MTGATAGTQRTANTCPTTTPAKFKAGRLPPHAQHPRAIPGGGAGPVHHLPDFFRGSVPAWAGGGITRSLPPRAHLRVNRQRESVAAPFQFGFDNLDRPRRIGPASLFTRQPRTLQKESRQLPALDEVRGCHFV
jgi:hypothetical protein